MGRKRLNNTHLPRHVQIRRRSYYYVTLRDGKQQWTALGKDYGEALRQWADLEGSRLKPALTVSDTLAHYIDDRTPRLAQKTMVGYRAQAKTLAAVFGQMRLADLKRSHVYTYLKKRGNVAGNRERDLLRAAINHARNLGFQGENPCEDMHYRNPESPRDRYVTDAELDALVAAAHGRFALLIQWQYLTGMRIGDAIALPLTAASEDGIRWKENKTGKPRFIEWSDALRTIWRAAAGHRIGTQPVFLGQRGPYTLDGAESTWAHVRARAGIENVTMHDLRRKAASDVDLRHAQALLGHSDPHITQRTYRPRADGVKPVK